MKFTIQNEKCQCHASLCVNVHVDVKVCVRKHLLVRFCFVPFMCTCRNVVGASAVHYTIFVHAGVLVVIRLPFRDTLQT